MIKVTKIIHGSAGVLVGIITSRGDPLFKVGGGTNE